MRLTEQVETSAGSYTVKELTVGEVRAWLKRLADGAGVGGDAVEMMLFGDFTLPEIAPFVDGQIAWDECTQADARRVFEAVKRLNPDFFALRERLSAIGRRSQNLEAPPIASAAT